MGLIRSEPSDKAHWKEEGRRSYSGDGASYPRSPVTKSIMRKSKDEPELTHSSTYCEVEVAMGGAR